MFAALLVPAMLQAALMVADERTHRVRGLPRWERRGHPIDTATAIACFAWLLATRPGPATLAVFVAGAAISCVVITKDEYVHVQKCTGQEHWLHAMLFVLHPIVLGAAGLLWWTGHARWMIALQLVGATGLFVYQIVYWNLWNRKPVNVEVYEALGDRWYEADDHPIALLRAEHTLRVPWVARKLERAVGGRPCKVLDLGCGGGFLANALAELGHDVTGIDMSADALAVAARHDRTGQVRYMQANAYALPFLDDSFDAVCAMDFLEHVDPERVVAEVARVLAPGGVFVFYTFNRGLLAWLIAIKGVALFVKNTPRHLHVLHLFIKPAELGEMCRKRGLERVEMVGVRPRIDRAFARLLATRRVPRDFGFKFTRSLRIAYAGVATKR